jgi:hypothetical protein
MGGYSGSTDYNDVQYTGIYSVPRIGNYTVKIDTSGILNIDTTPTTMVIYGTSSNLFNVGELAGSGTRPSAKGLGGVYIQNGFADDSCSTYSSNQTKVISYNKPFNTTFATNGCSTSTNVSRYVWARITTDYSQSASFPDVAATHPLITGYTLYFHPNSGYRLRGGATGTTTLNGNAQVLDSSP